MSSARKGLARITRVTILLAILGTCGVVLFITRVGLYRTIEVTDAYWSVAGARVERIRISEQVTAHVILRSWERYDGEIVLRIRTDVRWWLDKSVLVQRSHIVLSSNQPMELKLVFQPYEASEGNIQGYYVEVGFDFPRGMWTMPGYYPPRLLVTL